jgi:hypothetical protein
VDSWPTGTLVNTNNWIDFDFEADDSIFKLKLNGSEVANGVTTALDGFFYIGSHNNVFRIDGTSIGGQGESITINPTGNVGTITFTSDTGQTMSFSGTGSITFRVGLADPAAGDPADTAYLEFAADNSFDRVEVSDHNDFSFGNGSTDSAFSIVTEFDIDDFGETGTLICKWDGTGNLREWNLNVHTTGQIQFFFYDESTNATQARVSDAAISTGRHTLVVTYDGTGGSSAADGAKIYVDGVEVASTNTTGSNSYVAMENLAVSVWMGVQEQGASWTNEFDGKIYRQTVYSGVISDFTNPFTGPVETKQGEWKIDEGSGNPADTSGNAHNGTNTRRS